MCLFVTLAQRKNIGYNSHKDIQKQDKGVSCHMCYDDNARPPLPPSEAGAAYGEYIVLEAADGKRFATYAAQLGKPTGAQILIFSDVRGRYRFNNELAMRLAE